MNSVPVAYFQEGRFSIPRPTWFSFLRKIFTTQLVDRPATQILCFDAEEKQNFLTVYFY